jgi:hypothetical protein
VTKYRQTQHRITEWYLRSFAHPTKSGPELDIYDLQTGVFDRQVASTFMAPKDDHSREIERELEQIETPASRAAYALLSAAGDLGPGFYALADETSAARGEQFRQGGTIEGFSLLVAEGTLRRPPQSDEIALAKFLVLMYSRSPKHEAAATDTARVYGSAILKTWQAMGFQLSPGALTPVTEAIEGARWFGLRRADELGEMLRSRSWWLAKAGPESSFIIGDSPVVSGIAIGHDAGWQPLAGNDVGVLAFPLSPSVALVVASPFVPLTVEPTGILPWINRTTLRWADRYIAAHDRAAIEVVLADTPGSVAGVAFPRDPRAWSRKGVAAAIHVVIAADMERQFAWRDVYHPDCRSRPPDVAWATKRKYDV